MFIYLFFSTRSIIFINIFMNRMKVRDKQVIGIVGVWGWPSLDCHHLDEAFQPSSLHKDITLLLLPLHSKIMEENMMKTVDQWKDPLKPCGKGGFKASAFIFAMVALENIGFVANTVSMVLYFSIQLHFDVSSSANTLTNLMGSTFLLSILSGFLSDTFLNRYKTVLLFGTFELVGLLMMTIQAHDLNLQPKACGKSSCVKGGIAIMFYASLALLAMGTGGIRGVFPALGADQFDRKDSKEAKALATYFNWLLLSSTIGATIGLTVVVWFSTKMGWWKGFLISLITTFVGLVFLAAGKPFYRLHDPGDSPLTRIIQVIIVAIRNRKLTLPKSLDELYEVNDSALGSDSDSQKIQHTQQFRCLDKAAVLAIYTEPAPWKVCTVTQVEEVKILTRMMPIIASTIIMNTCLAQLQTFSVQQCYRMNRHIGSFEIPAPSVPVFPMIFMSFLIPLYEFIFVPFARKFTNHPSGITQLQRVGVGLVLSVISMSTAAIVEVKRKEHSIKNPYKPLSVFWLSIQYGIFGIADMFTLVGLLEFFYKEAPIGMKSLSTSFTYLSLSFGYFLSSIFVDIINSVSKRIGHKKQGWLEGQDLDRNNLNLFYWFLAIVSCLNFFNYLYWASWYKYKKDEGYSGTRKRVTANGECDYIDTKNGVSAMEDEGCKKTANGVCLNDLGSKWNSRNNLVFEDLDKE